ncbi:hypothetical protein CDD80_6678 [Ophiocordyceps camponoti-rufipedis]|uniref:Gfo/Idh/MocA-like oxidoreductase N-terminal domain-containing protein n=1 Tax=Ophiocordyceps camponoti-rufipedis TaxID=2004952 RepID=A0A2C5ZC15_9HYPO|nr:hypothetical protein CDD80_6678 [Ophiocordyceps camponoti-rufipedis]
MAPAKLKMGVAGLGRMGKRHALNYLEAVPRAELVAVSTPEASEREWARENLPGVAVYEHISGLLAHQGLQAVCVASATAVHAEQSMAAMEAGKHVLCEKPLATTAAVSQTVVDAAARHPDLKVMCGFSRRFDESYRDAHAKAQAGLIGRPSVFRSQTCDMLDPSGFFVAYAEFSGGIFVDCSIHDIDLALWFFGEDGDEKVRSVSAVGITAVEPGLRQFNDRDNAVGLVEFADGRIAHLYCSRMMAAGQEDTTEIIGTKGKLAVNSQPTVNLVRIHGPGGIRHEVPQTYWDRFRKAFTTEAVEFVDCCLDDKPVPVKLETAVAAVRIAAALQESMITGNKIFFNDKGERTDKPHM